MFLALMTLAQDVFLVETGEENVYRVGFEDLQDLGFQEASVSVDGLKLTQKREDRDFLVLGGEDGRFDPGDQLVFYADVLHGEFGYRHEYAPYNVFLLCIGYSETSKPALPPSVTWVSENAEPTPLHNSIRLEMDTLMGRFKVRDYQPHEVWYWHKLSCVDTSPFSQRFEMPGLSSSGDVGLRIGLRGWSFLQQKPGKDTPDHVLDIVVNEEQAEQASWNGTEEHVICMAPRKAQTFSAQQNTVQLQVPRREANGKLLVDVSLLNWVEILYPLEPKIRGEGQFPLAAEQDVARVDVTDATFPITVFPQRGPAARLISRAEDQKVIEMRSHGDAARWVLVAGDRFQPPERISCVSTSLKPPPPHQTDYVIITHKVLAEQAERLARFHRQRGLSVRVLDVADLYLQYNHGIIHPGAIRDCLKDAWNRWEAPKPRFVLLMGDASWDTKNEKVDDKQYPDWTFFTNHGTRFVKNGSTPYDRGSANDRNLIPTWNMFIYEGHAASDNAFVCLEGDDLQPEMAIGRIPVVAPEEAHTVVDKSIAYATAHNWGPWRKNVLFITNESMGYQRQSDRIAQMTEELGFLSHRVYPESSEKSNEHHSRTILDDLNEGQFLVSFLGHGGRYIWRTGPPDLKKNHDLFTLDHLDELEPNDRYTIVLSFTCYSAPFDHPGADSIGEKFLRIPHKGAVAVVAASWRNSPHERLGRAFVGGYCQEKTVGEAFLAAKREISHPVLLGSYNLLGDPALPLPPWSNEPKVDVHWTSEGVTAVGPDVEGGKAVADLHDEAGTHVLRMVLEEERGRLQTGISRQALGDKNPTRASWYWWNPETGAVAAGVIPLSDPSVTAEP